MAMDIIKKTSKSQFNNSCLITLLTSVLLPTSVFAGDWQLKPRLKFDETYTDNIELSSIDNKSSFVIQGIAGLDATYMSNLTTFEWSGNQIRTFNSHNNKLNDSFRTLKSSAKHFLGNNGLALTASASIANINKSNARNLLSDLISGDTVEQRKYSSGLQYNYGNNSYSVKSSVDYNLTRAEDNIGDNNGLTARLSSENGRGARNLYWQLSGNYTKRKQNNSDNDGENYTVEALLGLITSSNITPFIRYYDENVQGSSINRNKEATASWGSGVRWLASPHVIIDLSYNFVDDKAKSDNYVDASLEWEPSERTSLVLGYSQRFFGNSYNFNLEHKTKRLTNSIKYDEKLEVFDRNTYQTTATPNIELVKSDEFSLNKNLSWSSQLQLPRTSFNLNIASNERTSLATNIVDDTFNAAITIIRTISPKSNLSVSSNFNYSIYDKDNPAGSRQKDYYRTVTANFTRNLASALSYSLSVKHVNRDSSINGLSYDEVRAIINITKEF